MANTFEQVQNIISEQLKIEKEKIQPESSVRDDLDIDSLDVVELMMAIEDEFDIEIPDEDAESLATIQDIVTYIDNKIE